MSLVLDMLDFWIKDRENSSQIKLDPDHFLHTRCETAGPAVLGKCYRPFSSAGSKRPAVNYRVVFQKMVKTRHVITAVQASVKCRTRMNDKRASITGALTTIEPARRSGRSYDATPVKTLSSYQSLTNLTVNKMTSNVTRMT